MFDPTRPLAIIAGNGSFPLLVAETARRKGCAKILGIGHRDETNSEFAEKVDACHWIHIGQLGKIVKLLRANEISQIIFAGGISRSQLFRRLRPDMVGTVFLTKLTFKGDDTLLRALTQFFEKRGVTILDGAELLSECLASAGLIAGRPLTENEEKDVVIGRAAAQALGAADIGQAVVVHDRTIVAVEALEGTDAMIKRAGEISGLNLKKPTENGLVVVKCAKPNQELRMDRPTVGVQTLFSMRAAGATVLAVEAQKTLLLDPQKLADECNALQITLYGIE